MGSVSSCFRRQSQSLEGSAKAACFMKSLETSSFPEESRVCNDPLASAMIGGGLEGFLCDYFPATTLQLLDCKYPNISMHFASRTRYLDDCVNAAIDAGFKNVVILGAGFDTRAYRLKSAAYFEVDRPSVQQVKQERLDAANLSGSTLIPVDFQVDSLAEKMQAGGVSTNDATMFALEGVTQYISREAIDSTLTVLSKFRKVRLVFTYVDSRVFGDDAASVGDSFDIKELMKGAAEKGEPWITGFATSEIPRFLRSYGMKVVEDVGFDDFNERFYKPIGRGIENGLRCERFCLAQN